MFNKKEYQKKYYQDHAEELRDYRKRYYRKHTEESRNYQKKYNIEHIEKIRDYRKEYNKKHIEKIQTSKKKYDKSHTKKRQDYRKKNKEEWMKIIIEKGFHVCRKCGYSKCFSAIDLHHLDPNEKRNNIATILIQKLTSDKICELDKVIPLCVRCHRELHAGLWNIDVLGRGEGL